MSTINLYGKTNIIANSTQSVTNSTVLTDFSRFIGELLDVGNHYLIDVWAPFNLAGVASGYQFKLFGPTGPGITNSFLGAWVYDGVGGSLVQFVTTTSPGSLVIAGALPTIGNHFLRIQANYNKTGGGAGTAFKFQFAQNVADPAAITMQGSSVMSWQKLS